MTPQRAALLISATALARQQSMSEGLRTLGDPMARAVAQSLDAGKLDHGLRLLGLSPSLSALVAKWPRALGPALRRFDRLPSASAFKLHLGVTAGYLALVFGVQLLMTAVVMGKVWPVLADMSTEASGPALIARDLLSDGRLECCLIPLGVWLFLGATGSTWFPGWGRHYARAEQFAMLAALLESEAPDEVRAQVLPRSTLLLERLPPLAELEQLFLEACSAAEQRRQRFLVTLRVVGLGYLTLLALMLGVSLYTTLAFLPVAS